MKKICFIVAMMAEAKPLIQHFGLLAVPGRFGAYPMQAFEANYQGLEIILVLNGRDSDTKLDYIGCEAGALSAHLAIASYHPDILVNIGTAGGFAAKGAAIGDVFLSDKYVVFHDRRVAIAGWDRMGQGYYPCVDASAIAHKAGFKLGICTTGSSLDMTLEDEAQMQQTGGEIKDMEAAAIAWVAQINRTPLICVKTITDLVDSGRPTDEEFTENLQLAAQRLEEASFKLIDEDLLVNNL